MKISLLLKQGKLIIISSFILLAVGACNDQETSMQKYEKEQIALNKYLTDNNITTKPTASGLYYIETLAGTGQKVTYGRWIAVKYEGRFLDGRVFDASGSTPFEFYAGAGQVIPGWDEAVMYMKDGGKATLIIPSTLAYGPYGSGTIPGYTPLVFDIEITNVN